MAETIVAPEFGMRCEGLFIDPSHHPDPGSLADTAESESYSLLDEIKAVAEVLMLADQNQDTQFNEDTITYTCHVIRRLVEQKQALDSLASRAREAAQRRAIVLRNVAA